MTEAEFNEAELELLSPLPPEFRSVVSSMAYERGHSYGMEEVLLMVQDIVGDLLPAIQVYKKNITLDVISHLANGN